MEPRYIRVHEFFKDAKHTSIFDEVKRQVYVSNSKGTYSRDYCINVLGIGPEEYDSAEAWEDPCLRINQDWSYLANKVVGAEPPQNNDR